MVHSFVRAVRAALVFLVICGLLYPLVEVQLAQGLFPHQADGSLTRYGSTLIGQRFEGPAWFHGRPDADNDTQTGGTNLGPRYLVLVRETRALLAQWRSLRVVPTEELITTSGSGVDPDISVASALVQVPMVAWATGLPAATLRALVRHVATGPEYGFLGERVVNVLELNIALHELKVEHGLR